jgi:hypothetical protein
MSSSTAGATASLLEHARLIATAGRATPAERPEAVTGDGHKDIEEVTSIVRRPEAPTRRAS